MPSGALHLVVGPPGTGRSRKTHYLSGQAARAAEVHGPHSVAVCSLTRTAAENIAGRTALPEPNVGTLHAACYRGLDRPDIADTPAHRRAFNDAHPEFELTAGRAADLDESTGEAGGRTTGDGLRASIDARRARMQPVGEWPDQEQELHRAWQDYKVQVGTMDFTDLLEHGMRELPTHPLDPQVLLVDEAQDHSALELALVAQWSHGTTATVLAGDPWQAIFSWRGADPAVLAKLPFATTRVLERSRRVPAAVQAQALAWMQHSSELQPQSYLPRLVNPDDPASGIEQGATTALRCTLGNPAALADQLARDREEGRSAMVLATCGYMLAPLLAELRSRAEPFHNPYRPDHGAWNPLGYAGRLESYARPAQLMRYPTHGELWDWVQVVRAGGALARGAKTWLQAQLKEPGFGEPIAQRPMDEDGLAAVLGPNWISHPGLHGDLDWLADHLLPTAASSLQYALQVARTHGLDALTATPNLVAGTVHSVKGSEASRVYVCPDLSRRAYWSGWALGGAARDSLRRLFYVALTRARDTTVLLAPNGPEHAPTEEMDMHETDEPRSGTERHPS